MKVRWIGVEKTSPLYGLLTAGREFECSKEHAASFISSKQAKSVGAKQSSQPKGDK